MLKKILASGAILIITVSAVGMSAGTAMAQRGGGGHGGGGGFHGGGFGGGFHGGGFHGGGFHSGGFNGGFHQGFSHARPGVPFGHRGFRAFPFYGGYYPDYGWDYPDYGFDSYDQSPYTGGSDPYGTPTPSYYGGNYLYQSPPAPTSGLSPSPTDGRARLTLKVPADAEVWIEGTKTAGVGATRYFQSPPLESGYRYSYDVWATWKENGREVTQTQTVPVSPGANAEVIFIAQPTLAAQPSATKTP
jgi:uncharacterized protein (TIGR03000 family)